MQANCGRRLAHQLAAEPAPERAERNPAASWFTPDSYSVRPWHRVIGFAPWARAGGDSWCGACRKPGSRTSSAPAGPSLKREEPGLGTGGVSLGRARIPAPQTGNPDRCPPHLRSCRTGGRTVKSIVYDEATIASAWPSWGQPLPRAYPDGDLLVLGLLKGSFIFLGDLVRKIERPLQVDFLWRARMAAGMTTSGVVRLLYDPETRLEGKHIVLVEDIVDSGNTIRKLIGLLQEREPASLAVCALLDKIAMHTPMLEVRFVGFQAPSAFLVGYGLDHSEDFRHLPFIADLM
jgi:hypoxanthine phosphoribosyltransferase